MDGFNLKNQRDNFGLKNNLISVGMEIKKIFIKPKLKVSIKNKNYNVIGRLGMYHAIIDITGTKDIFAGDEVRLDISPIYTNSNIRREYI